MLTFSRIGLFGRVSDYEAINVIEKTKEYKIALSLISK